MAAISPYDTAHGKRYRVRYRMPNGRQTDKRGFLTKKAAEGFANRVEVSKDDGSYIEPSRSKVTVGEWAQLWLDGKSNLTPSTRSRYQGIVDKHVLGRWETTPVGRVDYVDVQRWLTELTETQSAASVTKIHRVLSQILDLAVRDKRIPNNPAHKASLPRVAHKKRRYLTAAQVEALAEKSGSWGPLVLFLAYTGLRWGEMAALTVGDVDMLRRRVHVTKSVTIVEGKHSWGEPKDYQHRWVPLPRFLADVVAPIVAGKASTSLLFAGERAGKPLRSKVAREAWFDQAVIDARCPEAFTPHELRHTAASLAVSAGASVKAVQRMLGHAKASMTLDTYADLFDDDLESVGIALDVIRASVGKMWADGDVVEMRKTP
ncbi:tyrosine-type recombinase/integrase [Antrihabitans sp. YC3-6]|uniref:Tyrosine-type recombinase/integrase n=1 Tax=Antrihabitans stalagmiti TaxID=2799499 RepID=A0A934U6S3_9NOCA|nr:site-specific integrase [Antrihabitans stalagmiti]MBJ8342826.1 tyrosine-type recombinase/integrase [Antrihabitans stalagmiti]